MTQKYIAIKDTTISYNFQNGGAMAGDRKVMKGDIVTYEDEINHLGCGKAIGLKEVLYRIAKDSFNDIFKPIKG